jgi:hypothetical protein
MTLYDTGISMATSGTDLLEVPTIYKVKIVRGYNPKLWLDMVQHLHFTILEFSLGISYQIHTKSL